MGATAAGTDTDDGKALRVLVAQGAIRSRSTALPIARLHGDAGAATGNGPSAHGQERDLSGPA